MTTTLCFEAALLPTGWADDVRLTIGGDGLVTAVETGVAVDGMHRYGPVLPGLSNLHSHAFQRAMAGLTERRGPAADSFWTWRTQMYRLASAIDPDAMAAIAQMAFVEMLECGFTRTGEFHYVHHQPDGTPYDDGAAMAQAIVEAAAGTGIGLTLLPVFYAASGFGGAPPTALQRRFVSDVDGFARIVEGCEDAAAVLDDAVVGVAPHSLRAVPPGLLDIAVSLRPAAPIHIHIAEQVREVEDCIAWSGRRPVEWLFDRLPVDGRWCLVHATHVTPDEVRAIAASGAVAGLCPITEANLGDGIFPAASFMAQQGRMGIGSDSNVAIDAAGELRLLEYGQRLVLRHRNVLAAAGMSTGRTLFDAACGGGAQALGIDGPAIAVGSPADLVALDRRDPRLDRRHKDALLDSWIFAGGKVRDVWRRGVHLVGDGRHAERDRVSARFARAMRRLLDDR